MTATSYRERITAAVLSWPGTEAVPHRFGGIEFRLGRRELGHIHGDRIADLPLPRSLRDELVASGEAETHRWRPDSGWVTIQLTTPAAVERVIDQLHAAYDAPSEHRGDASATRAARARILRIAKSLGAASPATATNGRSKFFR